MRKRKVINKSLNPFLRFFYNFSSYFDSNTFLFFFIFFYFFFIITINVYIKNMYNHLSEEINRTKKHTLEFEEKIMMYTQENESIKSRENISSKAKKIGMVEAKINNGEIIIISDE